MIATNANSGHDVGDAVGALLRARAQRLEDRLALKVDEPTLLVAQFCLGAGQFALPLSVLRAAIPLKLVTPVPLSPPQVVGIARYQGRIITALSLAALVGVKGWRSDPTILLVVEAGPGKLIGLDCEEIPKPGALPLRAIEKARSGANGPIIEVFGAGLPVQLIDLGALLQRGGWINHGR